MSGTEFEAWPKIPRLEKQRWIATEKIDGTNAQVSIRFHTGADFDPTLDVTAVVALDDGVAELAMRCGSRNRWVNPKDDNAGFARYVWENADEIAKLGPGRHYGEWWGQGIQRGYGLDHKRFSLFNTKRWTAETLPTPLLSVVPLLVDSDDLPQARGEATRRLGFGSVAAPGFTRPEGFILYEVASGATYKHIFGSTGPKSQTAGAA